MDIWAWVTQILGYVGIISTLCFTASSYRFDAKTRRIANVLILTQNQRELLKVFYQNQKLDRVLDPAPDIASDPVNIGEEIYVTSLIHHLSAAYQSMQNDLTIKPEGIRQDVRAFFSMPIPKFVWNKIKPFQDHNFADFIDGCLNQ